MATKSVKKSTTKKPAKAAAPSKRATVRECINANEILKLHVTVITVLSFIIAILVAVILLTLAS